MKSLSLVVLVTLAGAAPLSSCVEPPSGNPFADAGPDAPPPPPPIQFAGTYVSDGHWDLSRPLGDEGLGGYVADILVAEIVSLLSVPSAAEQEATDIVAGAIREPVRDLINGVVPPDLGANSPLLAELRTIMSDVQVGSTITLAGSSAVSGTEVIDSVRLEYNGTPYDVPMDVLLAELGATEISADLTGSASTSSLAIDDHEFQLRYSHLLEIAGQQFLSRDDVDTIGAAAAAVITCADVTAEITGGNASYGITVAGESFSISATQIDGVCDSLVLEIESYVLGMFSSGAGIVAGGGVSLLDPSGDRVADSIAGNGYDGAITLLPGPIDARVTIEFTATP